MLISPPVIGVMIALILLSAAFFGGDVAKGPQQVSLILATVFALFVALLSGFHGGLISQAIQSSVNGTFSPGYDWHLLNLRNYANLQVQDISSPREINGVNLAPFGVDSLSPPRSHYSLG